MKGIKLSILVLVLFTAGLVRAQQVELGVTAGGSLYSGDLAPEEFGLYFEEINPAFGFFGRYNTGGLFSLRLGLTFAKVTGADANGEVLRERDLRFRSNITEAALTGELNLFRLGQPGNFVFSPYVFGGVGIYHFNPEGFYDNGWVELQPLRTEAQGVAGYEAPYELTQINLPVGGGVKFVFGDTWTLGFEFGGRKLFTDHLDDVSSQDVRYRDVLENSGTRAAQLSNPLIKDPEDFDTVYRRGGKFDDWYYVGNVTVSFFLNGGGGRGRGIGCPTF